MLTPETRAMLLLVPVRQQTFAPLQFKGLAKVIDQTKRFR